MAGDDRPTELDIPPPERAELEPGMRRYFEVCDEKLGFVPNVLRAYSFDPEKLGNFVGFYNELMMGDSGLSKLEREMIAVVVSAINHCHYCLVAHGQAVRKLSGDPAFGETLVTNYRAAELTPRQRAMLDFAAALTERPDRIDEPDRAALREAGFSERDIWDIAAVAGFFAMTNRLASATGMRPNPEYHALDR